MQILRPGTEITTVWNAYLRADYATWEPGQTCEIHSHQNAVEIFVILSGAAEFWVEGETAVVPEGSTVYVGPGQKHKLTVVGDESMQMFLAVLPNHTPTHTFYAADGTEVFRDRQPPTGRHAS
ncbi:MAG TPA: cupin domain-containing protein [Chloroflexota bacterium]|nr:cupin domain-containing protein [Chloroflexota bacterium]